MFKEELFKMGPPEVFNWHPVDEPADQTTIEIPLWYDGRYAGSALVCTRYAVGKIEAWHPGDTIDDWLGAEPVLELLFGFDDGFAEVLSKRVIQRAIEFRKSS